MTEILINNGANLNLALPDGKLPIHLAASKRNFFKEIRICLYFNKIYILFEF